MSDTFVFISTFSVCMLMGILTRIAGSRSTKKKQKTPPKPKPKQSISDTILKDLKPYIDNGYVIESFEPLVMSRKDSYNGSE